MIKWPTVTLDEIVTPIARTEEIDATKQYNLLGVRLDGKGPFLRETVTGTQIAAKKLFRVVTGDFIYSRLFACRGAFGIITDKLNGCFVSDEFPTFLPVSEKIDVKFLKYWFRIPAVIGNVISLCSGSTPLSRNRFKEKFFLSLKILLPPLSEQRRIVARIEELAAHINEVRHLSEQTNEETNALTNSWRNITFKYFSNDTIKELSDVAEIIGGGTLPDTADMQDATHDILLLKVSDMNRPGNELFITDSAVGLSIKSTLLRGLRILPINAIVFPKRGGAIATNKKRILQRPAVLDPNMMGVFSKNESLLNPIFLFRWFETFDLASLQNGTSVPQINKGDLAPLKIPVPPLPEQRRILPLLKSAPPISQNKAGGGSWKRWKLTVPRGGRPKGV